MKVDRVRPWLLMSSLLVMGFCNNAGAGWGWGGGAGGVKNTDWGRCRKRAGFGFGPPHEEALQSHPVWGHGPGIVQLSVGIGAVRVGENTHEGVQWWESLEQNVTI